jgi:hypothetical protein
MELTIVTMWYNEEKLAPFFLDHYRGVDKIIVILDTDTADSTREICKSYPNVEIKDFTFPDMFDDVLKTERINQEVLENEADWIIGVDSDEFIFAPKEYASVRDFLAGQSEFNVIPAQKYEVRRHVADKDLDVNKRAIYQRQHGFLASLPNTEYGKYSAIRKPVQWGLGFHECDGDVKISDRFLYLAHWQMADVNISIERRIYGRKMRHSKRNIESGFGTHNQDITEEAIIAECEEHKNCPNVLGELLPEKIVF